MTTSKNINSKAYWNNRFSSDWVEAGGIKQSQFFATIAIAALPLWLRTLIRHNNLSVCDWGCAQGDGTDVLYSSLGVEHVTGVDFSETAIICATARYTNIHFLTQDWLTEAVSETFDVVFSSNTLEHFSQPDAVLAQLAARANKLLILALPFREIVRLDEHEYTFLPENIPFFLNDSWVLIASKVVDCSTYEPCYWHGEQIVLVYAHRHWTITQQLCLMDVSMHQDTPSDGLQPLLNQQSKHIQQLEQLVTTLRAECATSSEQAQCTKLALVQQQQELMALSNLVQQSAEQPIRLALKKWVLRSARYLFRMLPLSLETKHRLRSDIYALRHRLCRIKVQPSTLKIGPRGASAELFAHIDTSKERDILIFSVIDWHFRMQRPQHLAQQFAATGRRVFFFSNHFINASEPGYEIEPLDANIMLYQVKLHVIGAPAIYFESPSPAAQEMLAASFALLMLDYAVLSTVSIVQHGYWYPLVQRLPNTYRVYDCMDHHEGFGDVPKSLLSLEQTMLRQADLVVVTSSWLEHIAVALNARVALIRNAGDYAHFARSPDTIYHDDQNRPIIGYYGAIAEWFDLDLVRTVAEACPTCLVLLIGHDSVNAKKILADLSNVRLIGEVPYTQLPFYLYAFDVCLLPFKIMPLTLATNPVKVYEYLAAGRAVVSVDLPEMSQFGDAVVRAASTDMFVQGVQQALSLPDTTATLCRVRQTFASQQTWAHRIVEFNTALRQIVLPKISVIILVFNNLDLTKACLQSVIERTDYAHLEIIIVDNHSTDGTREYLQDFGNQHTNINIIFNKTNVGFAAGNNIGLTVATGDYLVLLNNDTVVTQGWAMTLMRHAQANPKIGLVGPVTNNIGNEAKIDIHYEDIIDMPRLAANHTAGALGRHVNIPTLAFFCVLITRQAYEKIGPLDEAFGLGYFEDDDYCRRAEQLGFQCVCAEDVFIHHHLSASFNKMKNQERRALFESNKITYEAKWGKWQPHRYRTKVPL